MKFAIITHVPHGFDTAYFAYAPYVREMNIWIKFADEVILVAPMELKKHTAIHISYHHQKIQFSSIKPMDLLSWKGRFKAVANTPKTIYRIFRAMKAADHIHLRCPGNIGLLGCFVQILFPNKTKTAKYAGNWDPKAQQPFTYKLQKWILNNTFLTKNMQALVYGDWRGTSQNIKPFFTATYYEKDKEPIFPRSLDSKIKLLFVGTLSPGKRPLYAIKLAQSLRKYGFDVELGLYGEGAEKENLRQYCRQNNLQDFIVFHGNQTEQVVRKAYKDSHFLILPSQSEGWPKVVAEAMFWGCLPVATAVSCVPYMLDYGDRGIVLTMNQEHDASQIKDLLGNESNYRHKVLKSVEWSEQYTLDLFQNEIKALLNT